jgi:hypothetical protein
MQRVALFGLAAMAVCGQAVEARAPLSALPAAPVLSPSHAPMASLRVYAPSQRSVWQGRGDALQSVDLCVVSTTGRFRLQITSQSGGALINQKNRLHYTMSFRDGAGSVHDVDVSDQALVMIEGSAPSAADCHSGPNSTLSIKAAQSELLKGQAGEYFDRLRLVADPL